MRWAYVAISVISGSVGDLLSAYGMAQEGEQEHYHRVKIVRMLYFIVTHRVVIAGIVANAISFISFMALLGVSDLNFAVPVTAVGYILRTALARIFLGEYIDKKRWAGAILVTLGVILIAT